MPKSITTSPNKDNRIIIELYGEKIELDRNIFNEDNFAKLTLFGEEYEVCLTEAAKPAIARTKRPTVTKKEK